MAVARPHSVNDYLVAEPEIVPDSGVFLNELRARSGGGCVLLGFDFPIGLPFTYCETAGIKSFPDILPELGKGCWSEFYEVAKNRSQISIQRPFYPYVPGGKSRQHLLDALGAKRINDLLRDCECSTSARPAASPLFWTLGAKQVGRAAITGWREVLAPAIRNNQAAVKLWPFAGDLNTLLEESEIVIVESYPAEACVQIGLGAPGRGWSKRNQVHRRRFSPALKKWAQERGVGFEDSLLALLDDGFGPSSYGEDKFDAVIGLFGMLDVVLNNEPYDAPPDAKVRTVEGWIFGLPPS
jgi:hypothetical protein